MSKFQNLYKKNGLVPSQCAEKRINNLKSSRKNKRIEAFDYLREKIMNNMEDSFSSNKTFVSKIPVRKMQRPIKKDTTTKSFPPFIVGIVRHKLHSPPFLHEPLESSDEKNCSHGSRQIPSFAPKNYKFKPPREFKININTPAVLDNNQSPFTLRSLLTKSDENKEINKKTINFDNVNTQPRKRKLSYDSPVSEDPETEDEDVAEDDRKNYDCVKKHLWPGDPEESPIFGRLNVMKAMQKSTTNLTSPKGKEEVKKILEFEKDAVSPKKITYDIKPETEQSQLKIYLEPNTQDNNSVSDLNDKNSIMLPLEHVIAQRTIDKNGSDEKTNGTSDDKTNSCSSPDKSSEIENNTSSPTKDEDTKCNEDNDEVFDDGNDSSEMVAKPVLNSTESKDKIDNDRNKSSNNQDMNCDLSDDLNSLPVEISEMVFSDTKLQDTINPVEFDAKSDGQNISKILGSPYANILHEENKPNDETKNETSDDSNSPPKTKSFDRTESEDVENSMIPNERESFVTIRRSYSTCASTNLPTKKDNKCQVENSDSEIEEKTENEESCNIVSDQPNFLRENIMKPALDSTKPVDINSITKTDDNENDSTSEECNLPDTEMSTSLSECQSIDDDQKNTKNENEQNKNPISDDVNFETHSTSSLSDVDSEDTTESADNKNSLNVNKNTESLPQYLFTRELNKISPNEKLLSDVSPPETLMTSSSDATNSQDEISPSIINNNETLKTAQQNNPSVTSRDSPNDKVNATSIPVNKDTYDEEVTIEKSPSKHINSPLLSDKKSSPIMNQDITPCLSNLFEKEINTTFTRTSTEIEDEKKKVDNDKSLQTQPPENEIINDVEEKINNECESAITSPSVKDIESPRITSPSLDQIQVPQVSNPSNDKVKENNVNGDKSISSPSLFSSPTEQLHTIFTLNEIPNNGKVLNDQVIVANSDPNSPSEISEIEAQSLPCDNSRTLEPLQSINKKTSTSLDDLSEISEIETQSLPCDNSRTLEPLQSINKKTSPTSLDDLSEISEIETQSLPCDNSRTLEPLQSINKKTSTSLDDLSEISEIETQSLPCDNSRTLEPLQSINKKTSPTSLDDLSKHKINTNFPIKMDAVNTEKESSNEQDESLINDEIAASPSSQTNKQQGMSSGESEGVDKISNVNNKSISSTSDSTSKSINTTSPSENEKLADTVENFMNEQEEMGSDGSKSSSEASTNYMNQFKVIENVENFINSTPLTPSHNSSKRQINSTHSLEKNIISESDDSELESETKADESIDCNKLKDLMNIEECDKMEKKAINARKSLIFSSDDSPTRRVYNPHSSQSNDLIVEENRSVDEDAERVNEERKLLKELKQCSVSICKMQIPDIEEEKKYEKNAPNKSKIPVTSKISKQPILPTEENSNEEEEFNRNNLPPETTTIPEVDSTPVKREDVKSSRKRNIKKNTEKVNNDISITPTHRYLTRQNKILLTPSQDETETDVKNSENEGDTVCHKSNSFRSKEKTPLIRVKSENLIKCERLSEGNGICENTPENTPQLDLLKNSSKGKTKNKDSLKTKKVPVKNTENNKQKCIEEPDIIINLDESPSPHDKVSKRSKKSTPLKDNFVTPVRFSTRLMKANDSLQANENEMIDLVSDDEEDYTLFLSRVLATHAKSVTSPKSKLGRVAMASIENIPKIQISSSRNSPRTPRVHEKDMSQNASAADSPLRILHLRNRTVISPSPIKMPSQNKRKGMNKKN